jgi:outer membrane receptor protein involved in Fe transport
VQDTYHVRRNLSLNLGLRYEFQGAFSEVHNRLAGFDPSLANPVTKTPGALLFTGANRRILQSDHTKLLAPRIGLAWSLRPDLVVRSSYGVFYRPMCSPIRPI